MGGRIGGDVSIAGGSVLISGDIGGDVDITAGEIDILPGARIAGNLSYLSARDASIATNAVIEGEITRRTRDPGEDKDTSVAWLIGGGFSIAWLVGLVATGTMLMVIFPESLATDERAFADIKAWMWGTPPPSLEARDVATDLGRFCRAQRAAG